MLNEETRDDSTRMIAAQALAQLGRPAIPSMEQVFDSQESTSLQVYVVRAVREYSQDTADVIPLLEKALKSTEEQIRVDAAASLGTLGKGTVRSREILTRIRKKDTSTEVRMMAAWALTQLEHDPAR
ncbi:MAG: hypothetical protein JWO38_7587 [Gemmataceae bacterium]|nr:hypothetical protein [Gemmataceae bacterium]